MTAPTTEMEVGKYYPPLNLHSVLLEWCYPSCSYHYVQGASYDDRMNTLLKNNEN